MALHAEAGGAPDLAQRALDGGGVELAGRAARGADDGVVAARGGPLALAAGAHRAGAEHAVDQPQFEQHADVAIDRDAVERHAAPLELVVQLAGLQWASRG